MNGLAQSRKQMLFIVAGLSLILLTMGYAISPTNAAFAQEFKGKIPSQKGVSHLFLM